MLSVRDGPPCSALCIAMAGVYHVLLLWLDILGLCLPPLLFVSRSKNPNLRT